MKGKRILSAVLSAALLLQLSPLAVFAEDTSLLPVTAQTALTEPAPEEPTPEPAGEETALPEEPAPEETAVPMAVPTPEPTAESTAAPAPEETAAPDAAETPAPEPSAEPTAAPDPAAAVQAMIDALPDEVTEDNAAAVEQALTDIDDAKQSLTEEELAGLDFARYDAAANALLALWGEAPTDEVEMLDAYPTPNKDDKGCYLIDSAEKLLWFANEVNTNGRTNISAKLIDDIKLNGENKVLNDDGSLISNPSTLQTWTPIGTDDTGKRFTGTFDGNNKTIRGLYINDSTKNYVGLFGCVGKNGKVIDVTLADSYVSGNMNVGGVCGKNYGGTVNGCSNNGEVTGTSNYVGGVCGKNYGGSVNGCYNTGKVTGTSSVGGVCGENNSNVAGCYNEGHVTGTWTVGGVCGNNYGGTVKGCYNTKAVTGKGTVGGVCGQNANSGIVEGCHNEGNVTGTADDGQQVGGVCGYIESGTVKKCHNDGTVTGNNFHTGGVCGQNTGKLQECSNTGEVSGTDYVGGVCGTQVSGTVQECYNTGKVTGAITGKWGCIGGVCGWNNKGTLEKSYNTNTVPGTKFVGGVCGKNNNTVNGCYNTGNVTGTEYVGGVCGSNDGTVKGCYYLDTNTKAVGSGTDGVNCASKTKLQFQNGAVAYQMQADLGETAEQVWGQKLGTDKTPVLSSETDYKVYHPTSGTSPCTGGYSNKSDGTLNHQYQNSVCIYCGEPASEEIVDGYYQIATADQLRQFAEKVNSGNYNINAKLTADIKLNGDNKVLNDDGSLISDPGKLKSWTPIGTFNDKFIGTFDGNGKTIYGLYYNNSGKSDVGLFCGVGEHGKVINVTLADSYVSGNNTVGGICGWNDGGTLQGCHNTGTVSGAYFVGGVCGINRSGTIQKCDNAGTVSGTNSKIGGVCGSNGNGTGSSSTTIQEGYNTGKVSGKSWVGGVCGQNTGGTLEKSYNTNTVTGTGNYIGGVCGDNYNSGTVNGCYNTGTVSGGSYVGGVCGESTATVENCYYLSSKSGTAHSQGGISKTLAEFNSGAVAYLLQKALDDAAPEGTTAAQVWGQKLGADDYPVLSSNPAYKVYQTATDSPCKGYSNTPNQKFEHQYDINGVCSNCGEWEAAREVDGYYQITNQGQLRWFANLINTTSSSETKLNARLMNDITMDGTEWTPIGTSNEHPFTGDFDGNGKTITGLKCTKPNVYDVGLVGYASKATIQNVTVKDSSFIGNERIGAVCGSIIDGKITGCTNSGSTVSGGFYNLGGIAGRAENTPVQRCFNSGAVIGKYSKIGGIVGQARSAAVQDCGNTGTVTKTENGGYYGGIIGLAESGSTIENCYNTDKSTAAKICGDGWYSYSNCYYLPGDTGSSGSTGTDIIAKTQAQFNSGEVAYLLQKGREQAVWGQKIDTDDYPKLGGEKVYQSAPCKSEYTNTESKTVEHVFGSDGICEKCGQPQIAYTVTIPATVTLGNTATITAKDVILPNNKTLNVKVAEGSEFKVAQVDDNDAVVDKCAYTVTKGETKTPVNPSDTVLTAVKGESEKTVELQFNKPETTTYSGEYKGTVKFTVSVDDKPAS